MMYYRSRLPDCARRLDDDILVAYIDPDVSIRILATRLGSVRLRFLFLYKAASASGWERFFEVGSKTCFC